MYPPEDDFLNPDIHIKRLERIEASFIEQLEHIQDPKLIIQYQKKLNKLLKTKMEWIELKNKLELIDNVWRR